MNLHPSFKFFLNLAKTQAIISRKLDAKLGGLGLSEFTILYHLSQAEGEKLRRIELAEKVGLTASGVTRLLLPMEKVGYIKKEANENDARVSLVKLASGGKRKLEEAMSRIELFCEETVPAGKAKKLEVFSELMKELTVSM